MIHACTAYSVGAARIGSMPGPGELIEVKLHVPGRDGAQTPLIARCKFTSATGIGLEMDFAFDAVLQDVELGEVSFNLPGCKTTQALLAWITNRRLTGRMTLYGLQFDAERTRNFSFRRDDITAYVMRRQREQLQKTAHLRR